MKSNDIRGKKPMRMIDWSFWFYINANHQFPVCSHPTKRWTLVDWLSLNIEEEHRLFSNQPLFEHWSVISVDLKEGQRSIRNDLLDRTYNEHRHGILWIFEWIFRYLQHIRWCWDRCESNFQDVIHRWYLDKLYLHPLKKLERWTRLVSIKSYQTDRDGRRRCSKTCLLTVLLSLSSKSMDDYVKKRKDRSSWTREMYEGMAGIRHWHVKAFLVLDNNGNEENAKVVVFDLHFSQWKYSILHEICFPSDVRVNHVIDGFGRPFAEQDNWRVDPSTTVCWWIKLLSSTNWGGTKSNRNTQWRIHFSLQVFYQWWKDHIQRKHSSLSNKYIDLHLQYWVEE